MKIIDRYDTPNECNRGAALPKPKRLGWFWNDRTRHPRLRLTLGLALLGTLLFGLVSTLPAFAAYQYRMVVTNTTGAPLYLYIAPWDTLRGDEYYNPTQSSCLDMAGGLGVQRAIPVGGNTTLVFNRSGRCSGKQGWLSLRASANPQSTGTDYQQFWFDDDEGALEKHGRTSLYQNQLAGSRGFYSLNVLTATDLGHDYFRYGYKMAVKNSSTKPIWVTAAPDDKGGYGHLRSSCITANASSPFGQAYQLLSGEIKNFYFTRSVACSGKQGYFSLRASAEPNSIGTDFEQFDFDADTGTLQRAADGVKATWPNALTRLGMGHYLLDVTGAETVGGYLFRNYGYQFPEYANWPGQNPVTRSLGNWDGTRQYAELTWRTTGQNSAGQPVSLPIGKYASCFGNRYWHTQSMVQLPSKDGHAYFARTDSFRRLGSFYVVKSDADAYDPVNDYVKDTPGTDGAVVYLDQYSSGSPIGDWNHPGDMSIQLHNYPGYSVYLPGQRTAHQVFSFGLDRSPSVKVTPSFTWLKQDVANATAAGKNIIINFHDLYEPKKEGGVVVYYGLNSTGFRDAVRGANVVAIFGGHIHQQVGKISTYSTSDGTKGRSDIPVIQSGSAECETLVYADFHEGYFNWSVVSSKEGTPAWENDRGWVCDDRKIVSGYIFSIDVSFVNTLDALDLSTELRAALQSQGATVSPEAKISLQKSGEKWHIEEPYTTDTGIAYKTTYRIRKDGQVLDLYDASFEVTYNEAYNREMLGTYIFAPQIAPKPVNCSSDAYEPNNEISASVPITPGTFSNLSICGVDTDYFAVALNAGDTLNVDLTFANSAGNLEMEVLNPSGQVVGQATSTTDNETLSLVAAATGAYQIKVFGAAGASNPTYDLGVDVIAPCPLDSLEPNNAANFSDAAPLAVGATTGLTICRDDPVDTYAVALRKDTTVEVAVNFTHADGDLEVAWYNFDGKLIKAYRSSADGETFTFDVPVDAPYYLQVYASGNVANSYDINIAVTIPWELFFNWSEQSFREGIEEASIQYVVRAPSNQQVTVNVVSADGTADGVADYQAFNTTTTESVGPNATVGWIDIPIVDDTLVEADETFTITLTIGDMSDETVITIVDNDFSDCTLVTAIPADQCQALVDLFNGADDGADGATWSKSTM